MKRKREDKERGEKESKKQKKSERGDHVSAPEGRDASPEKKTKLKKKRDKETSQEKDKGSSSPTQEFVVTPKKKKQKINSEKSGGTLKKKKKQKITSETSREDEGSSSSPKKSQSTPKKKKQKMDSETSEEEEEDAPSPKKSQSTPKKKKQKMDSETSEEEDEDTPSPKKEFEMSKKTKDHAEDRSLADWTLADYKTLLDGVEAAVEELDILYRIPTTMWGEVKVRDHSEESCVAAWSRLCQVAKRRMTIQDMLRINREFMNKTDTEKRLSKVLTGKENPEFPDAPQFHLINAYNVYTKHELKKTPQPTFKEVAENWKCLEESERQKYVKEAAKMNEQKKEELSKYLDTLSPEERERYELHNKPLKDRDPKKLKKRSEFADAPKKPVWNSYNIYTSLRLQENPRLNFKDIAEDWKHLDKCHRENYVKKAAKVNEQKKKELSEYLDKLSPEERERYDQLHKPPEKKVKAPPPRPRLKARDLKKAELQFLKQEKQTAMKEKPDLEEEEILSNLSEVFRSLSYEQQEKYHQAAENEASEQKKITEFYKQFESPRQSKGKKSQSSRVKESISHKKTSKTTDSSEKSSGEEGQKKREMSPVVPVITTPKKKIQRARSSSSSSSSSSDDEDDAHPKSSGKITTPKKTIQRARSSSSSSSSSDEEDNTHLKSSGKITTPKKKIQRARSSSSYSSSSSDEEDDTRLKSSGKITTPKKKIQRARSSSSSSSSSSDEEDDTRLKSSGKSPLPSTFPNLSRFANTPTSLKNRKPQKSSPSKVGRGKK
ncbi:titin homolog isoform X2 [Ostrea edulis]|uniref:titin homolog isoform X2 n=1 Tax=Ostrea edulis TaxID=37623 RepID=UPI0024AFFAB8|nr:titin homolog isoform X2 [Ostrea edulis]